MRLGILLIFLLIAGCSSTGGTVGGLFPAPKFLKGNIDNFTYTAPDKSFQVAVPYTDPYQLTYAKVTEERDKNDVTWVIFGPAATDLNLYHAVLIKHPVMESLDKQTEIAYEFKQAQHSKTGGSFSKLADLRFDLNGRKASYGVFENNEQFLVLTIIDFGNKCAAIDAQIPKLSGRDHNTLRNTLVKREWVPFNAFMRSFKPAN